MDNIIRSNFTGHVFCYEPLDEESKQKFIFIYKEKQGYRVNSQLDKNFPKHWFNQQGLNHEKIKIPGLIGLDRKKKTGLTTDLQSAINLSRYLLPMRSDQLKISIRSHDFDEPFLDGASMWLCNLPPHTTFRYPRKWRGLSGSLLENQTGVKGSVHCTPNGQTLITAGMMESYEISKVAYKVIYEEILSSAFQNIRINVLVMTEYLSHWQKMMYKYEHEKNIPDKDKAKLAVFPIKNTIDSGYVIKCIPSFEYQNRFCNDEEEILEEKSRYMIPISFRGKTLQSSLETYPLVSKFFDDIKKKSSIKFDISGTMAVASCLEDAENLARILIKYDAFFTILSL